MYVYACVCMCVCVCVLECVCVCVNIQVHIRRMQAARGRDLQRLKLSERVALSMMRLALILRRGARLQQRLRMGKLRGFRPNLQAPKLARQLPAQAPHNRCQLHVRHQPPRQHVRNGVPDRASAQTYHPREPHGSRPTHHAGAAWPRAWNAACGSHAPSPLQGTWSCSLSCPPPAAPWGLCTSAMLPCDASSLAYEFPWLALSCIPGSPLDTALPGLAPAWPSCPICELRARSELELAPSCDASCGCMFWS